jgi:uncharacterized RDD family membrane protein YckC
MRIAANSVVWRVLACVVLVLTSAAAAARAATPVRDVAAEGAGDMLWVAEVVGGGPGTAQQPPAAERTRVYSVVVMGADGWQRPTMIGAGVRDLAHRGTQLVALLKTGEWMFVWPDGRSTGPALPADGDMVAVGGDGTVVWAVGRVLGGMRSVPAPPSTAPATREANGTRAATAAATRAVAAPAVTTAPSAGPPRLVLFRLERTTWVAEGELPEAIPANARHLSMAVVRGRVIVTGVVDGEVVVFERGGGGGTWAAVGPPKPDGMQVVRAKVLDGGDRPILWAAGATGAGVLYFGTGQQQTQWGKPVELRVQHDLSQSLPRDVAVVAQRVRLIFARGEKLFIQSFDWRNGEPKGQLTPITPATGNADGRSGFWINAAVMGVLMVVMIGAMRRRGEIEETVKRIERIPLAPLGLRFAAAVVDLWPYWLAGAYAGMRGSAGGEFDSPFTDPILVQLSAVAMGLYIGHTMLMEMLFGASVGKMLFGLRVVQLNGQRPGAGALFVRNLMRAIDFGLIFVGAVMILMSPLRQRLGDLAAGTLVVRKNAQIKEAPEEELAGTREE